MPGLFPHHTHTTTATPRLAQLFETGVDEMSWDDLSRGRDDWPPVREVTEYRRKAYEVVRDVILNHPALDKPEVRQRRRGKEGKDVVLERAAARGGIGREMPALRFISGLAYGCLSARILVRLIL